MLTSSKKNAWSGYAFEQVCLHHVNQIKKKLGISGIASSVYAWSQKPYTDKDGNEWDGGQIDLIIDRADGVMNLCEMKYSSEEFKLDKNYEKTIRDRIALFKHTENTRKALRCTFVTTYGIKANNYRSIVDDEVILDDLFL